MTSPLLSTDQLEAIEATRHDTTAWPPSPVHHPLSTARDALLGMVRTCSPSDVPQHLDHAFWRRWRSTESGRSQTLLHFATHNARDTAWLDVAVDVSGVAVPNLPLANHPALMAFKRSRSSMVPLLTWYDEQGADWGRMHRNGHNALRCAAESNWWPAVEFLLGTGAFPDRQNHVERLLMDVRLPNGATETRHAGAIVERLWYEWGMPDANGLRDLFRSITRHALAARSLECRRAQGFLWLGHAWGPHNPQWEHEDTVEFVGAMVRGGDTPLTRHVLTQDWECPPEVWAHVCAAATAPTLMRAQVLRAIHEQHQIQNALRNVQYPDPARRM